MAEPQVLIDFDRMTRTWQTAKIAMITAEDEIDAQARIFFEQGGPPPSWESMEKLMNYRLAEYEARGALDEFIAEQCEKTQQPLIREG